MSDLNDPRVLFAAERTLLAWSRTSLTLMAFGFVIERFGLFVRMLQAAEHTPVTRGLSFWLGLTFIATGALAALLGVQQFRTVLRTLRPIEIPTGYRPRVGIYANLLVAVLGFLLTLVLLSRGPSL
jgi:putative membrane protein